VNICAVCNGWVDVAYQVKTATPELRLVVLVKLPLRTIRWFSAIAVMMLAESGGKRFHVVWFVCWFEREIGWLLVVWRDMTGVRWGRHRRPVRSALGGARFRVGAARQNGP